MICPVLGGIIGERELQPPLAPFKESGRVLEFWKTKKSQTRFGEERVRWQDIVFIVLQECPDRFVTESNEAAALIMTYQTSTCTYNFGGFGLEKVEQGHDADLNRQGFLQLIHYEDSSGMENPS
jgi:hypothetical protein